VSERSERHPLDDLAAYALDAVVDGAERRSIEDHLAGCATCREQLAVDEHVLSRMVDDEAPPPTVWTAIVGRIAGPAPAAAVSARVGAPGSAPGPNGTAVTSAATVSPGSAPPAAGPVPAPGQVPVHLADRRDRHARGHRHRRWAAGALAAAAALVVAAGFGTQALRGDGDGGRATTEVAGAREAGVVTDEDGRALVHVMVGDDGAYVVIDGLEPLPEGRAYQMWRLDGGTPESLGMIGDGTGGERPITLPPDTARVAISDEPAAGSPGPTGPIVGTGELSAA
jgi:Anti-sigma-K factor rskA, C-terminal